MQELKIVPKDWGEERWIANRDYCGKLLILKKGYRCSLHHHKIKDETFYVSKGRVLLECGGRAMVMNPGDAFLIEPKSDIGEQQIFTANYAKVAKEGSH
jgi:mannose-6-phosphate isomerase-like protein (cupin superfamily)